MLLNFFERSFKLGYRFDMKGLTGQQQAIIRKRENENLLRNNSKSVVKEKEIYPLKIFIKLGWDSATQSDGEETLDIYKKFAASHGSVWFSTDSHPSGMGQAKRVEFINAIKSGKTVQMYFITSKKNEFINKIIAVANVQDIRSDKAGMITPEGQLTPEQWRVDKNKIWIKLTHINCSIKVKCSDFIVASSNRNLMEVLSVSQHHFGYIKHI